MVFGIECGSLRWPASDSRNTLFKNFSANGPSKVTRNIHKFRDWAILNNVNSGLWLRILPAILLLVFAILCAGISLKESATYDESRYLGVGRYVLTHFCWDIADATLHPPLSLVIHDLPLFAFDIPTEIWGEQDGNIRGQRLIALRSDDWMLNAARLAMLPVGVLLGWQVFHWSRRLHGDVGAILSLSLFCFCPNLLAHSALITPDITLTCATVFTLFRLWRLARAPGARNLLQAGLGLGLLLLSKYTALLLVAVLITTDLVFRMSVGQIRWRQPASVWHSLRHWLILLAMGMAVVWAAYFFNFGTLTLPSGSRVPMFAVPYFKGTIFQWNQSRQPHSFFLMGRYSGTGWWYYYLVTLLIKVPLGTLLLVLGLWLGRRRLGLRYRPDDLYLIMPFFLLLIYLSCFSTLHNGIRYLLPVYPLILVLIGKYGWPILHSRLSRTVVCLLVGWVVAASLWIWPNDLAYFNEIIGGPSQGYHWLGDSNLDWGQDLKGLKLFMTEHGIPSVRLAYFGTADPDHYGIAYEYMPSANTPFRPSHPLPSGEKPAPIVALSAYQYQAIGFQDKNIYSFFYRYTPNYMIGYSILVYDLSALIPRKGEPLPARIRHALLSWRGRSRSGSGLFP